MTGEGLKWWNRALLWTASVIGISILLVWLPDLRMPVNWRSAGMLLTFASPGWLLFLPLVLVMKSLRGWRSFTLIALGAFTGYAIPFLFSLFDLINHAWFTHQWDIGLIWPIATSTLVFSTSATVFGSLSSISYVLLFRTANYAWRIAQSKSP